MSDLHNKSKKRTSSKTTPRKAVLWEDNRLGRPFVIGSLSLLSVTLLLALLLVG